MLEYTFLNSSPGKYGEAGSADYAATKSGTDMPLYKHLVLLTRRGSALMYGFTLSLKNEIVKIAPRARVNCVAPGWVRPEMPWASLHGAFAQ